MSMTDDNDLHWTEEDGAICFLCDQQHFTFGKHGYFTSICEQCQIAEDTQRENNDD